MENTAVKQDSSGLVTGVNGLIADAKKNEYWAFYINGKISQIGPSQYQTKNSDIITWKSAKTKTETNKKPNQPKQSKINLAQSQIQSMFQL